MRNFELPCSDVGRAMRSFVHLGFIAVVGSIIFCLQATAQFAQQGSKLVGTGAVGNADQGYYVSISSDGNTAIIGGNNDNSNAGAAWVWTRSGGVWTQQGTKLVGTGAVDPAYQGTVSLSSDGNTAIVGGYGDNNYAGAVWVWTRSGGVWTQQGSKLVGTGAVSAGWMVDQGTSVALSSDGNTAIVGGGYDNTLTGAVWVWTRSGGVWTQQGSKLVGTGAVGSAHQGNAVSLSSDGNTAIIGGNNDNSFVGAAWVWTRSGGVWTQQGMKLVGTGVVGNAEQGISVSLSSDGNTAIVGGHFDNSNAGAVWVFTRSGGVWTQQGSKLVGTGAAGNAYQGKSVSLSSDGNTAIVGGFGDNSNVGAEWVWTRSGGVWTQQGSKLVGTGAVGNADQGYYVSISSDGNTAIIGGNNDNSNAGAAWVYATAATVWQMQLTASIGTIQDNQNYAGVANSATDGFDTLYDVPKPPLPGGNYVQLYFPHPEYNQPTGNNFSQDIRANHVIADTVIRWTFEVNTNMPDSLVSLNFISDGRIPSGFGIMLRDLTGGTRKNLKQSGMSYAYNSGAGGIRRFEILIGDSTGPALTILHPNGGEIIESASNYLIQWNGSDRVGFDSIQILYSSNAGTSYNPITMLFGPQTSFSWAVPQIYLNYQGSVAIVATDSMGYTTKQASATVFTIVGDSLVSSFNAGWNLMGTSLRPNDSTVVGNFSDDISQSYYVYDYSPSSGYTRPSTLVDGHGYWLGLLSNQAVDVIGHPVMDSVAVPLAQGFNIVSNPLVIRVPKTALSFAKGGYSASYQTVIDSGWIANGLTGYNSLAQTYQLADTMEVWNAYWIGALQSGVTMIVKPPMTTTIPLLPTKTPTVSTPSLADWQISIIAQFGNRTDQPLTFGVNGNATPGFNSSYDTPKAPLPPVSSYVETYFLHPTWAPVLGSKFVSELISPSSPLQWTFFVHTSDSGSVTLTWNSQDVKNMVPSNVFLSLNDQSNGSSANMRSGSSYTFSNSSTHQFTISGTVTSVQSGGEIPSSYSLNQNFPNPFNPSSTIRYGLPARSHVRLQIYNILGQVVADLVNTEQAAGWNQVVWNANVASGLYFYRLEAVSVSDPNKRFVDVKKMILLK